MSEIIEQPVVNFDRDASKKSSGSRSVTQFLRVSAWLSFILNVVIIATGGTVRLTASGLGCTEWPVCTPGSLTPIPETGIHGIIEFANRTLSAPLLILGILVFILSLRLRKQRKDLLVLSALVLLLVIAQALLGAFVVWFKLNANLVGVHYVASLVIVCIAAAYLVRMYQPKAPRIWVIPTGYAVLTFVTALFMVVTIYVGVLTTGAGPHSGDANVIRQGFDATLLSHVHAWPGYITLALILVLMFWAARQRLRPMRWTIAVLIAMLVQIAVGVYQARTGLPPVAVGIHMVLASLTAAGMTVLTLRLRDPKPLAQQHS